MRKITIHILIGILLASGSWLNAQTAYGIRDGWFTDDTQPPKFFTFETDAPATTTDIATLPFADDDQVLAFERRGDNGLFYILKKGNSLDALITHPHEYYEIDINTGALSAAIPLSAAFAVGEFAVDFAWDDMTNEMYAVTVVNGFNGGSFRTIAADGTLGAAVAITGMGGIITAATFDSSGNFYVLGLDNTWYSVDLVTGVATAVGTTGIDLDTINSAHTAFANDVSYMPNTDNQGFFFPLWVNELYTCDLAGGSAAATVVDNIGDGGLNFTTSGISIFNLDFDAQMVDINVDNCSIKFAQVTVTIKNAGTQPISNFDVAYVLNGGAAISETYTNTINPFQTVEYTFMTTVDLTGLSSYIMDAFVTMGTDQNPLNDAVIGKNLVVTVGGGLVNEDFESGDLSDLDYLPDDWSKSTLTTDNGWLYVDVTTLPTTPDFGAFFMGGPAGALTIPHTKFMAAQEGGGGGGNKTEDYLFLPSISTQDYTGLSFNFDYYYEDDNAGADGPENAKIDISIDGGTTWTEFYDLPGEDVVGSPSIGTDTHAWIDGVSLPLDPSLEGLADVRFRFHYDDGGNASSGLAVDNVSITGTFTGTPVTVDLVSPLIEEAYVPQGTPHHVIYQMDFAISDPSRTLILNDAVFKTNGSYLPSDINIQGDTLGFRLWYSTDTISGPGDHLLGRITALPSNSELVFSCMNFPTQFGGEGTIFLTVDIADDAVDNRTIWVEAVDVTNDIDFLRGDETGTLIPSERQIIGAPPIIPSEIFMSDLFTPNGDGNNDNYTMFGGAISEENFTFAIFDRNGKEVYKTNNVKEAITTGWDGTVDGEIAPNGVYLWSLEGYYLNGQELSYGDKKTGVVRLLR